MLLLYCLAISIYHLFGYLHKRLFPPQLLGQIDMDTREWSDGVLTNAARQVVREPIDIQSWIVCDGDIDPEWIESLNSVLDDNRLLTMPSGERIQFGPNVNFLFESHDLSCASPATISRMGMIFLRWDQLSTWRKAAFTLVTQARCPLSTNVDTPFFQIRARCWSPSTRVLVFGHKSGHCVPVCTPFLLVLRQYTSLNSLRLKMASDRAKWSNYVPGTQLHIGYSWWTQHHFLPVLGHWFTGLKCGQPLWYHWLCGSLRSCPSYISICLSPLSSQKKGEKKTAWSQVSFVGTSNGNLRCTNSLLPLHLPRYGHCDKKTCHAFV